MDIGGTRPRRDEGRIMQELLSRVTQEQLPRSKYSPCLQRFKFPLNDHLCNEADLYPSTSHNKHAKAARSIRDLIRPLVSIEAITKTAQNKIINHCFILPPDCSVDGKGEDRVIIIYQIAI